VSSSPTLAIERPQPQARTEEVEVERMAGGVPARMAVPAPRRRRPSRRVLLFAGAAGVALLAVLVVVLRPRGPDPAARRESLLLNNRGQQALVAGDLDAARASLERALALDPANAAAGLNLGQVYRLQGLPASAESLFSGVLARRGVEPALMAQAHHSMAGLDLDAGAWDGAIAGLERALAADSSWVGPHNDLGYALVKAGRPQQAESVLNAALARFPGEPALLKNLALALMQQGRLDDAAARLEAALRIDPAYGPAYGVRAQVRARAGDLQGARGDLERYVASAPPPRERGEVEEDLAALGVSASGASVR
jgi:tetratricopeptide (TPR) repeat protein